MIAVIGAVMLAGFIAFGITEYEPSPLYAKFQHDVGITNDTDMHRKVNEWAVKQQLKRFDGVEIYVKDGLYYVPKPHEMPSGDWCSPFPEIGQFRNPDWTCHEYTLWAEKQMAGAVFGRAWTKYHSEDDPGHAVNVTLIDTGDNIRLAFYEPQDCTWVDAPDELAKIWIGWEYYE